VPRIVTSILTLSLSGTPTSTGLWPLALPAQNKKPKFYTPLPLLAHSASTRLTNSWKHTQNYKAQSGVISKKVGCISWDFTNTPWPGSISSKDYKATFKPKHSPRSRKRVSSHSSAEDPSPPSIYLPAQTQALPLHSTNQDAATPVEVTLPPPVQVIPHQIGPRRICPPLPSRGSNKITGALLLTPRLGSKSAYLQLSSE
jgi:hypothetical protein